MGIGVYTLRVVLATESQLVEAFQRWQDDYFDDRGAGWGSIDDKSYAEKCAAYLMHLLSTEGE